MHVVDGGDLKRKDGDCIIAFSIFSDLVESVEQTPLPEIFDKNDDIFSDADCGRTKTVLLARTILQAALHTETSKTAGTQKSHAPNPINTITDI